MDILSALIGLGSLAFFIVPIVYLQMVKKKEKKKFQDKFLQLARENNANISILDIWNRSHAIGIDEAGNKLFFLKTGAGTDKKVLIDLAEAEKCKLVNKSRTVDNNKVIDHLELQITFKNPGAPEKVLEFYDREESMSVNEEYHLIEKWEKLISSRLDSKRKLSMAG